MFTIYYINYHIFFQISHHKTAETGPVTLSINPDIYKMLIKYVKLCRQIPNFEPDKKRSIFITWPKDGGPCSPMDSSLVNKAVQRIWGRGPIAKKISATRIQKATTTAVRSAFPQTREVLAKHMSHSAETADRHYALHNQENMARPIGMLIETVMVKEDTIDDSVQWPLRKPTILALTSSVSMEEEKTDDTMDYVPLSSVSEENLVSSIESNDAPTTTRSMVIPTHKEHRRRSFAEADGAKLINHCEANLRSGNTHKYNIMATLQSTDEGKCLILRLKESLNVPNFWKVITDRIHAERRRRERQI